MIISTEDAIEALLWFGAIFICLIISAIPFFDDESQEKYESWSDMRIGPDGSTDDE